METYAFRLGNNLANLLRCKVETERKIKHLTDDTINTKLLINITVRPARVLLSYPGNSL